MAKLIETDSGSGVNIAAAGGGVCGVTMLTTNRRLSACVHLTGLNMGAANFYVGYDKAGASYVPVWLVNALPKAGAGGKVMIPVPAVYYNFGDSISLMVYSDNASDTNASYTTYWFDEDKVDIDKWGGLDVSAKLQDGYPQVDVYSVGGASPMSTAEVNAECDTAISDAALATAANLATVDGNVDAIKTKSDKLKFTTGGQIV